MKDKFFVIIPAYNEEKNIGTVIKEVKKYTKNIIVVDDGSTDRTYEVAKKNGVLILKHLINLGKGAALKTGCDAAIKIGARNLILIDADGQHSTTNIPLFKKKLINNQSLIIGWRELTRKNFYYRLLGSRITSFFIKLLFSKNIIDPLCGFRAFSKQTYQKIKWDSLDYGVEIEMITNTIKKKVKIYQIPISTIYFDEYKGVTFINGLKILLDLIGWRFNFKRRM